MTKRILSILLVLAMVVAVLPLPAAVSAEAAGQTRHTHTDAHSCSEQCSGNAVWTAWGVTNGNATSLPNASGHYYLECDITLSAWVEITAGLDITICLNGYNITETASATGNQRLHGKLTISDCTAFHDADGNYISGEITGCKQGDGAFMNVRRGGTLVLESGKITGCTATGGGGAISLQSSNTSLAGGIFHMYGGEITGNSAMNGGGVVANNGGSVYIHGGRIYGNSASGNGRAIYISGAASKLVLSGSPYIDQVYFDNASNPGVQVNGLSGHAKITVKTKTADAAINKVFKVADGGKQDTWDCHWVSINNQSVDKTDSGFVFGHSHNGISYSRRVNTMPEGVHLDKMNYYYLTQDIALPADRASHTLRTPVTICLNGYTVTQQNPAANIYEITGSLTLEDGWAYTDELGYHAGGFTSSVTQTCANGSGFYVNGGSLTLQEGRIFGFNSTHNTGNAIYAAGGGTVNIAGGELCGNTGKNHGGALLSSGATVNMTGGKVCHNTSGNQGGGICLRDSSTYTMSGGSIESNKAKDVGGIYCHTTTANITGGTIKGNTSTASGGGIGFSGNKTAQVENLTVTGNTAPNGGGMIVQGSCQLSLKNCSIANNTANLGGGIYLTATANMTLDGTNITGNTASSKAGGIYWDSKDSKLTLTGSATIKDNTAKGAAQNLFMNKAAQLLAVSALTGSQTIGLSNRSGFASGELAADYSASFFCDDGENVVSFKENKLYISNGHDHCQDGKTDCGHTQEGWTKWTATDSLPTGAGNYFLDSDVNLTGRWNVSSDIKLCLNGHTVKQTKAGQRILSLSSGTLTITDCQEGGKLTGGTATADGGGIRVEGEKAKLVMYNVTLTGNTTTGHGGGLFVVANAQAELHNVTVSDNEAGSTGGGITLRDGGKLTMAGGTVSGNYAMLDGAGLYGHKDSVTTITDTVFTVNTATGAGGGIGFGNSAKANVTGVQIKDNTALNGGGMIVQGTAEVTMTGSTLENNTATNAQNLGGGAVYLAATLNLTDCTLKNNTALNGGGIYTASGAKLQLSGGEISGNSTGIYVHNKAAVTLQGAPVVTGNTGSNVYLSDGALLQVGAMTDGAAVGITANPGAISTACDDYSSYFVSDSAYRKVAYADGVLTMVSGQGYEHKHCLCGASVTGCDHSQLDWNVWEKTDALPTSGCYYLISDVVLTSEVSISEELNLCLNGHTVTAAQGKRILSTPKDGHAKINISDCTGKGQLTGGVDQAVEVGGGAIFIRAGSTLNLYGGKITGNKSITAGGAILLAADATMNMYGGEISENGSVDEADTIDGGAIYAISGANLNLYGGTIKENIGEDGGAIFLSGGSTFTMQGGSIENNEASAQGGGVYCHGGTAAISGGTIRNNKAAACAGGIGFGRASQAVISGGEITGNTSPNGGGVLIQGTTVLKLEGGSITGNTSTGYGGGIYVNSGSTLTMTGGSVSENTSVRNGAGIYAIKATGKLTGGTIENNSAKRDGSGICVSGGTMELGGEVKITGNQTTGAGGGVNFTGKSTGTISGGTIQNNKSTNGGGVIIQGSAVVQITGGTIKGNTANSSGGGIYVNNSTLKLSGGAVTGNQAVKGQGGGMLSYNSDTTVTGGSFTYNQSKSDGGGIYAKKGTIRLSGMYIANNANKGSGGGAGASQKAKMILSGGTIENNQSINGAGLIIQGQAHLVMQGGTIRNNVASDTAGGLYIHKSSGELLGGTFQGNSANRNGGAGYFWRSTVKMDSVSFKDNRAKASGGGFFCYWTEADLNNILVSGNYSESSGGGVVFSHLAKFTLKDSLVENNKALVAAGILTQSWSDGVISGTTVRGNEAYDGWGGGIGQYNVTDVDYIDCDIYENSATNQGGGVYVRSARGSNTPLAYADFTNVKIHNNTSQLNGGGICAVQQVIYTMTDCQIYDNEAAETGGGLAHRDGANGTFKNLTVTGNKSGKTGAGIWISDSTNFDGLTVTGNKTAEGSAVYYAPSGFDGESYVLGLHKLSGNVRVCDNEGTMDDLFIGEDTVIGVMPQGFGADTKIQVQLAGGILTNTLLGEYDYEGGDLHYTVTAGSRSLTEPEVFVPAEEPETAPTDGTEVTNTDPETPTAEAEDNTVLYAGIGGIAAVIVLAAVIVILVKKKKTGNTTGATKE